MISCGLSVRLPPIASELLLVCAERVLTPSVTVGSILRVSLSHCAIVSRLRLRLRVPPPLRLLHSSFPQRDMCEAAELCFDAIDHHPVGVIFEVILLVSEHKDEHTQTDRQTGDACTAFALAPLSRSLIHLMTRSWHHRCTLNAIHRTDWCVGCMASWRRLTMLLPVSACFCSPAMRSLPSRSCATVIWLCRWRRSVCAGTFARMSLEQASW